MKFDWYFIVARLFPGILSGIPLFVLHYYFLRPLLGGFWGELLGLSIISDVTVSLVFLIALVQVGRFISKEVFERRMFVHGQQLPTTEILLHSDSHYTKEYKRNIHDKIKTDFNIAIPIETEEKKDWRHSRKLIGEAVSLMRAKVGKGRLVNQHNAEYGFWRNLAGGSVLGVIFALVNIILFSIIHPVGVAVGISVVLGCGYTLHLIFAKRLILSHGRDYANVLIQEYMSS